jgi:class 3 adenylate cyclase
MANEADRQSSQVERKLVTILSADVAEYSRLMSEDEERTLLTFQEYSQTFRALVDMHHGRIFNTAGDALLAEFTSPIEAVRCATDIQAALRTRNDLLPPARQVHFRIGVNLGDVMMQGSDLLGDGVNVAARLQGAAEPGGICISGTVYDQIRNKLSLNIEALGERRFKNISQPVRTFTIAATGDDDGAAPARKKSSGTRGSQSKSAAPGQSGLSMPTGLLKKLAIAGLSLLVLAGGYWAYTAYPRSPTPQPASHPNPTIASIPVTGLDKQSGALVADAQRSGRPQKEIDDLIASNTQIAALASQLHGLGKKPGDETKARSLVAQMSKLAVDMSHDEATALERAVAQSWRGLDKPPGKSISSSATAAIAAAQQAKTKIDNAIAAAQKALDGSAALKATSQALADYNAFAAACDAAAPSYIAARRDAFRVLATAARGISENVVALSRAKRPWLLASHARKDAYQTLLNNAAEAQSQVAQLDALDRQSGAATSIGKMDVALSRAAAIKASLNRLQKNSSAAFIIFNQ